MERIEKQTIQHAVCLCLCANRINVAPATTEPFVEALLGIRKELVRGADSSRTGRAELLMRRARLIERARIVRGLRGLPVRACSIAKSNGPG
jgi:hypothetical protein